MQATLPSKYYLAHAQELFNFVEQKCDHLLSEDHRDYLTKFKNLSSDAQCLLIRILSRKPQFLASTSLQYAEIENTSTAILALQQAGFVSQVEDRDWARLASVLTKQQLLACLKHSPLKPRSSTPKQELLDIVVNYFDGHEGALDEVKNQFLVRRQQGVIDFILFLYFGDLRNRLQKFAMRDLGVLKTRRGNGNTVARYASAAAAQSAFNLHKLQQSFRQAPENTLDLAVTTLHEHTPIGDGALRMFEKLVLSVGTALVNTDPHKAIATWRLSDDHKALENWVRASYKHGCREELKRELKELREQSLNPASKLFLEDFYCRKYRGKKTSIYTDLLREAHTQIDIDECFLGNVEEGVLQRYQQAGASAWFAENKLWHVLFAFTLWPILYGRDQVRHTEFDRLPAPLRKRDFYTKNKPQIEVCLGILDHPEDALKKFTTIAARHYGLPTGLFRWSPRILDLLKPCLLNAPAGSLAKVIRASAQDWSNTTSGYPDLMVLENGVLRFEEIKAPGDVLRPNQLVSIELLRSAGLQVHITQVNWATDPEQIYAVVDIETTGGRRGGNAITEIAVVRVRGQRIISEWSTLVNPRRPIPAHITRLTGINNQMVEKAPIFAEVADQLETQLDQAVFVAHNVGFDFGFIKAAYDSLNIHFRKPKFCTVQNSRRTFPGLRSYSLGNLCAHFDIDLKNAHRALDDARATAHLLCLIQQQRLSEGHHQLPAEAALRAMP